ncbi:MAG: glycosyltransferase [Alphaproteobacteria bacterium]
MEYPALLERDVTPTPTEPARSIGVSAPQASLLHIFPSFSRGGVPLRTCRIINHLGPQFRHAIVALDGHFEAARHLPPDVDVNLLEMTRRPGKWQGALSALTTLRRLKPDLLVTYNWGSIDWAIANRLSPVAPQLHFEDGFGREEADRQFRRRVLCRYWALARCKSVVVPSHLLEQLAHNIWRLPPEIITYIPNGVSVERFSAPVSEPAPGLTRRPGELLIGTLAPLRPEKNIGRLLRVFAMVDTTLPVRLVIAGDGAERSALERAADQLGIADRVVFTGHVPPESVLGCLDIFALSSDTEQMPVALLEAMAARLPVASVDVGDVRTMVSRENRQFIVARDDDAAFAAAIGRLLREPMTRARLGSQNRERVVAEFSEQRMFDRYSELFLAHLVQHRHDRGGTRLHSSS